MSTSTERVTILVPGDDIGLGQLIRRCLAGHGYEAVLASDPQTSGDLGGVEWSSTCW